VVKNAWKRKVGHGPRFWVIIWCHSILFISWASCLSTCHTYTNSHSQKRFGIKVLIGSDHQKHGQGKKRWTDQHLWRQKEPEWLIPCCCFWQWSEYLPTYSPELATITSLNTLQWLLQQQQKQSDTETAIFSFNTPTSAATLQVISTNSKVIFQKTEFHCDNNSYIQHETFRGNLPRLSKSPSLSNVTLIFLFITIFTY
jgi:hypothetical protein